METSKHRYVCGCHFQSLSVVVYLWLIADNDDKFLTNNAICEWQEK